MRVWPRNRYVAGARKETCARCGFDYLSTELVEEERTGLMVCNRCYDPPHPCDKVMVSNAPATQSNYNAVSGTGSSVDSP